MSPMSSRINLGRFSGVILRWPVLFTVLVLLRFYLTGDRDILALNAPYDEFWFVDAAARHVWEGPYDHRSFAQLPIYPLWLCLVHFIGAPAHLAIDVAWVGASAYLANAVRVFTGHAGPAALLFAFLLFHPLSIVIFDRALAETLLSVLSVVVLALGIEIWNQRRLSSLRKLSVLLACYAVTFALAFHTRKEGVVLFAPLALLALIWLFKRKRWSRESREDGRTVLVLVCYPLIATFTLGIALAGANYYRWGVFARYDLAAPGYVKAMAALAAIDNGRTPHDVTVTASTRALAYRESPTFRELEPYFESVDGQNLAAYTAQFTGVPGEIGNGWFYWSIREFAARAGWHSSAPHANEKYLAVAEELDAAFAAGRLKHRPFVLSGFIDPDYGKWVADFPRAFFREMRLTGMPTYAYFSAPVENATRRQFAEYVEVLGRRKLPPFILASGWIVAPLADVIGLERADAEVDWKSLGSTARSDVPGGLPFKVSASGYPPSDALVVRDKDGLIGRIVLNRLKQGLMATTEGDLHLTLGVDQLEIVSEPSRIERLFAHLHWNSPVAAWVDELDILYGWLGNLFWLATAAYMILNMLSGRRSAALVLVVLCLIGVIARCTVLGVLDASSWSGLQARYVMPGIVMFGCMSTVSLSGLMDRFRRSETAAIRRRPDSALL